MNKINRGKLQMRLIFISLLFRIVCCIGNLFSPIIFQIIRLQRLKQKQKALQARLEKPSQAQHTQQFNSKQFPIASNEKRKNPFLE